MVIINFVKKAYLYVSTYKIPFKITGKKISGHIGVPSGLHVAQAYLRGKFLEVGKDIIWCNVRPAEPFSPGPFLFKLLMQFRKFYFTLTLVLLLG